MLNSRGALFFEAYTLKNKKVFIKSVNKTYLFSLKDTIPTENCSGIYFISSSSGNLGYTGQTRRLKIQVNEHCSKVNNQEVSSSAVGSHCLPFNRSFYFLNASNLSSPISSSYLDTF